MSKAFVREDDVTEDPTPLPVYPSVPLGTPNYLTAAGAQRLRTELARLQAQRSSLPALQSSPETRREAKELDHRIGHLQQSLRTAEIVEAGTAANDVVRFGATAIVRDARGAETRYRLVGVDETDVERGDVSWLSPIARALLNAQKGERIRVKTPRGDRELEVLAIS